MPVPDDLGLLEQAAREAGEVAMRYWRQNPVSWDKGAGAGPVSEADLAVNTHLETLLRGSRPEYGWLSEESQDSPARLGHARQFIVDPIDGTRAFLEGQQGFAHSLAIAEAGRIIAGVVHLPAMGLTYMATETSPAVLNGQPILAVEHGFEGATVLANKVSFAPEHWRGDHSGLKREFRTSLAWRLCLVAEGRFNAAMTWRSTWEWDVAAASLIAARAGCMVTDRHGFDARFNAEAPQLPGLLVAPPGLHQEILARLAP